MRARQSSKSGFALKLLAGNMEDGGEVLPSEDDTQAEVSPLLYCPILVVY